MYLDEKLPGGGSYDAPFCRSCKRLISRNERSTRVTFNTDPDGARGLTGDYHLACGKPFASLARVININLPR